jgi:hypothetical protein
MKSQHQENYKTYTIMVAENCKGELGGICGFAVKAASHWSAITKVSKMMSKAREHCIKRGANNDQ